MLRLFLLIFLMAAFANAEINDLEALIKELEQKQMPMEPLVLPQFQASFENYKSTMQNNVFDAGRNNSYGINNYNYYQDYTLNQLQMVGYMYYAGVAYAFLKTPYETIKVRTGDKIKGGVVMNITNGAVEIDQLQMIDNKSYNKKIFIELMQPNDVKPKLQ